MNDTESLLGSGDNLRLEETQHRIANDFQLIASLIRVRLKGVVDLKARRHLKWCLDLVQTVALTHRRLASSGSPSLATYVRELGHTWQRIGAERGLVVTVAAESPAELPQEKIVVLGLVLNELMANAFKHAFAPDTSGHVWIGLNGHGEGLEMIVGDDGNGFDGGRAGADGSRGLTLVEKLVESIGGTFEIGHGEAGGTAARVVLQTPETGGDAR